MTGVYRDESGQPANNGSKTKIKVLTADLNRCSAGAGDICSAAPSLTIWFTNCIAFPGAYFAIVISGAEGDRTPNLLRARQALSQLSYDPNRLQCHNIPIDEFKSPGPKNTPAFLVNLQPILLKKTIFAIDNGMKTFTKFLEQRTQASLQNEADFMGAVKGAWQGMKQGFQGNAVNPTVGARQSGNFGSEVNALSSTVEKQAQQFFAKFPNIPQQQKDALLQQLNNAIQTWGQPLLNSGQVSQ